jgi:hypothetical protein
VIDTPKNGDNQMSLGGIVSVAVIVPLAVLVCCFWFFCAAAKRRRKKDKKEPGSLKIQPEAVPEAPSPRSLEGAVGSSDCGIGPSDVHVGRMGLMSRTDSDITL